MGDGGAGMGIMNKAWCIEQGAWPGTKETGKDRMGLKAEKDVLFDKMMGTGPFKFSSWKRGERVVLERFDDYYKGRARLKRVIRKIITDIPAGILLLKQGDVDFVSVSVSELPQVEGAPGLKVIKNLPSSWLMKINFVLDIAGGSKYIGDGKTGSTGIAPDFFSDINVRKAFQHCFDWDTFINDVFLGAALKPYGPVLIGFPTANPKNPQYSLDLKKAEEYLKQAYGGQLWEKGFHFTAVYSTGSTHRQRALEILKANIESLNTKFKIDLASLPWAAFVGAIKERQLPLTLFGILPDVVDPYLPLFEHMHSSGGYAEWGGYIDLAKTKYDPLIDELGSNYDFERRNELSKKLQKMAYDDSLAIFHFQAVEHVAMREWLKGYYTGPFPFNLDFYTMYKAYK
jgi:peptide/nickel transport system substrate-binding protein